MSPTPINPGQQGPIDPNDSERLREAARFLSDRMRKSTEQISKHVKDVAGSVEKAFDGIAKDIKESDIANNLLALHQEMAKGADASSKLLERLTEQARIHQQLASQKYQSTLAHYPALRKEFSRASYLPQEAPAVNPARLASNLARAQRAGEIAQGGDITELLGGPKEAVTRGIGGPLMERGMEGELFKASDAMQRLYAEQKAGTLQAGEYENRIEEIKRKYASVLTIVREINRDKSNGIAIAEREADRIRKTAHTGTTQLRSILPEGMARGLDKSKLFNQLANSEAQAAAGGKAMGAGGQLASMGMEKMAESIAKISTMAGSVSVAFTIITKIIDAIDSLRKVQGAAIPALSAGMATGSKDASKFATDVVTSNSDIYSSLRGTSEFMPLVTQAFATMSTIGYSAMRDTDMGNKQLARGLMQVGIAGKAMGMEFGQSMGLSAKLTKALGTSEASVGSYFKQYIYLSKIAGQSMDDFGETLGDVMMRSRQLGETGALDFITEMAVRVHGLDAATKISVQGVFKSLMDLDLTRQAGMAVSTKGIGGFAKLQQSMMGAQGAPSMIGFMTNTMGALMKQVSGGLKKGMDPAERSFIMSSAYAQISGDPVIAKALFSKGPEMEKSTLYKAVTNQIQMGPKEFEELMKKEREKFDPQERGAAQMTKSVNTLEKIYALLENTFRQLIFSGVGKMMHMSGDFLATEPGGNMDENLLMKTPNNAPATK